MKIHQFDENMAPDVEFLPGEPALLHEGNSCRLLDPRRTPGIIEAYFPQSAMFRWRITDFEHKGKCWDVPAEDVARYQFAKGSKRLEPVAVTEIETAIAKYQAPLMIAPLEDASNRTEAAVASAEESARDWLGGESAFFGGGEKLDMGARTGPRSLAEDMLKFMASRRMEETERKTAENIVLNPSSGEWIKGMEIVLAEMGLGGYKGKVPRTEDIFEGPGAKHKRCAYLIERLSFVRAFFRLLGIEEVVVYRGMSAERPRIMRASPLVSYTFNLDVARSFCDFDREGKSRNSLLLKKTVPVDRVFMTYLETEAMNGQYKEAEALVIF